MRRPMRTVRAAVVGAILAAPWMVTTFHAQTTSPAAAKRFDVASIKPVSEPRLDGIRRSVKNPDSALEALGLSTALRTRPGGRVTGSAVTLRSLIVRAFGITWFQIEGPAWIVDATGLTGAYDGAIEYASPGALGPPPPPASRYPGLPCNRSFGPCSRHCSGSWV